MAIPGATLSSQRIAQFARYHVAALKADPNADHLAEAVEEELTALDVASRAREAASTQVVVASAQFSAADDDLDEAVRQCHLRVLGVVSKDRKNPKYRAAFPHGLSAIVAGRGERQERQVAALIAALGEHLPDLASEQAGLLQNAMNASQTANDAYQAARLAEGNARVNEMLARETLIDQLHRNRGALRVMYPRTPRRLARFFPSPRRSPSSAEDEPSFDPESSADEE